MKKSHIYLLLFCLAGFILPLQAAESKALHCGWLLYIEVQEPYKIYINGEYRGITPQVLTGLPAGEFLLRLENEQKYHETKVLANSARQELTVYRPVPELYKGELQLASVPPGADIWIDDENWGETPLRIRNITEGRHKVSLFLPGYSIATYEVKISRTAPVKLAADLVCLYDISFEPQLQPGITVTCANAAEQLVFLPGENCLLPAGVWQLTIKGAGVVTETREITVNGDLQLAFTPVLFDSKLVFTNLRPGSLVFVDYKDLTGSLVNNQLSVPSGKHNLTVRRPAYLDYQSTVVVLEDRGTLVDIQYTKDPLVVAQNTKTAGWITAGVGAALSIAGLVINLDDIAEGMSAGSYDNYVILKYGSLGSLCTGGLGVIIGLLLQI